MRIDSIEVDDRVLDKIEVKHGLTRWEVEEVCFSRRHQVRKSRAGLYKFYGRTHAGRYLLAVLAPKAPGAWQMVTAREMTFTERRLYAKKA